MKFADLRPFDVAYAEDTHGTKYKVLILLDGAKPFSQLDAWDLSRLLYVTKEFFDETLRVTKVKRTASEPDIMDFRAYKTVYGEKELYTFEQAVPKVIEGVPMRARLSHGYIYMALCSDARGIEFRYASHGDTPRRAVVSNTFMETAQWEEDTEQMKGER